MRNVLIVKPSALGDVILSTCVLPQLKASIRGIRITWAVFEQNAQILKDHPLLDHVVTINRDSSSFRQIPKFVRMLRRQRFDAVIDLQGLLRSALISCATGCKRRIGYSDAREMAPLFYTEAYNVPAFSVHAADRYIQLFDLLGAPRPSTISFPLPTRSEHREQVSSMVNFSGRNPVITICPTAKWETKRWPPKSFAALADILSQRLNARIVLVGSASERGIVAEVARWMRSECLDLCGKISLMQLAALLERCDLYIGNDSALMHMASATGTKTVAIFGPTDPFRTGPYNPLAVVVRSDLSCMPCFKKQCKSMECLRRLKPEVVAESSTLLLS